MCYKFSNDDGDNEMNGAVKDGVDFNDSEENVLKHIEKRLSR